MTNPEWNLMNYCLVSKKHKQRNFAELNNTLAEQMSWSMTCYFQSRCLALSSLAIQQLIYDLAGILNMNICILMFCSCWKEVANIACPFNLASI